MDKEKIKKKIMEEEDFVYCPRLGNSLKQVVDRNPDGIDEERICKVLMIDMEELNSLYDSAIKKIRERLGVK